MNSTSYAPVSGWSGVVSIRHLATVPLGTVVPGGGGGEGHGGARVPTIRLTFPSPLLSLTLSLRKTFSDVGGWVGPLALASAVNPLPPDPRGH